MKKLLLFSMLLSLGISLFSQDDQQPYNGPLIPFKKGAVWGYSDINGHILISPAYDEVMFFTERSMDRDFSYAKVAKGGKWGIINDTGAAILSPGYDSIRFTNIPHYIIVGNEGKFGGYSLTSRKSVPTSYDRIEQIRYSYRSVSHVNLYAIKGNRAGILY